MLSTHLQSTPEFDSYCADPAYVHVIQGLVLKRVLCDGLGRFFRYTDPVDAHIEVATVGGGGAPRRIGGYEFGQDELLDLLLYSMRGGEKAAFVVHPELGRRLAQAPGRPIVVTVECSLAGPRPLSRPAPAPECVGVPPAAQPLAESGVGPAGDLREPAREKPRAAVPRGPRIVTNDQKEPAETVEQKISNSELKKTFGGMAVAEGDIDTAILKYKEALYALIDEQTFQPAGEDEKEKEVNRVRDYGAGNVDAALEKVIQLRCALYSNLCLCYLKKQDYGRALDYAKWCLGNLRVNGLTNVALTRKACERMRRIYDHTGNRAEQLRLARQLQDTRHWAGNGALQGILGSFRESADAAAARWAREEEQRMRGRYRGLFSGAGK